MMNVHNINDEKVVDNIKIIARSIYWRNVFIFMLGYIAKNKEYLLDNIDSYLSELNGSTLDYDDISLSKISKYGSLLALELLSESILANWPRQENKFIKHLEQLVEIIPTENEQDLLKKVREKIIKKDMLEILTNAIQEPQLHIRMSAWNRIVTMSIKSEDIEEHFYRNWTENEKDVELYYLNIYLNNMIFSDFILERYSKYLNWEYVDNFSELKYQEEFVKAFINSDIFQSNKALKYFLVEYFFVLIKGDFSVIDENVKNFLSLLEIDIDEERNIIMTREEELCYINPFKISIKNIIDFSENKMIQGIYDNVVKDDASPLLHKYFSYFIKPSAETLVDLYHTLKERSDLLKGTLLSLTFHHNWQLKYITYHIKINTSEEQVLKSIKEWGESLNEFAEYETLLCDVNEVLQNIEFLNFKYNHRSKQQESGLVDFYNGTYVKGNSLLSRELLVAFILEHRDRSFHHQHDEREEEKIVDGIDNITQDIINAINDEKIDKHIKSIALVPIVALISNKELLKIESSQLFIDLNFGFLLSSDKVVSTAILNSMSIIKFNNAQSNLIKFIFSIIAEGVDFDFETDTYNFDILYDLSYSDKELQTYGYLLSLCNEKVNTNKEKMNNIQEFLVSQLELNDKILADTRNIISKIDNKSSFLEDLLTKMYSNIRKDSISSCLIASKYENDFKNIFENFIIDK